MQMSRNTDNNYTKMQNKSIDNKQRNISRWKKGKIYHDNGEIY